MFLGMKGFGNLRRMIFILTWWGGLCLIPGCTTKPSGIIRLAAFNPHHQLMKQDFSRAYYSSDYRGQVVCVLISEPSVTADAGSRQVRQILVVRTFWLPQKGRTPVSDSSANMNLDFLLEVDGQSALYRGAGFALLTRKNSAARMVLDIRSANIKIEQQSTGFQPVFAEAGVTGKFVAVYQPRLVASLLEEFKNKCQSLKRR